MRAVALQHAEVNPINCLVTFDRCDDNLPCVTSKAMLAETLRQLDAYPKLKDDARDSSVSGGLRELNAIDMRLIDHLSLHSIQFVSLSRLRSICWCCSADSGSGSVGCTGIF